MSLRQLLTQYVMEHTTKDRHLRSVDGQYRWYATHLTSTCIMVRFPNSDLPTTWLSTSIAWKRWIRYRRQDQCNNYGGNELPIVNKMVIFDIGMLHRITKILSHPQSIKVSYNDNTTQYDVPTSQATISNPFDMEWYANGSILVFRFNVAYI